ncbi:MAG: protein phosphatase 2C domain-containing protein [Candidatus Nanopelagicales bacterium]
MATESQPAAVPPYTSGGTARLRLRYAARSDIGLVRQGNEDSGYAGGHMLVVADGMGGHAAGELASATAVATFAELDREPPGDEVLTALADAVDQAHDELSRVISASPDFAGMGTTVTALSWEGDRVALAHVGDSRAYLLRDGELNQLTKDHTFVQTLVDAGRITQDEAAVHEKRNLLIKALDGVHHVEPDLSMREVKAGDRFLLCSDGLSGVLNPREIRELLITGDPTGAVTRLVERAIEGGAPDNITCVVADLVADDSPETADPTPAPSSIPMPVVVGAAAELRNRDRLPGIDFPVDFQPDPDRPAPVTNTSAAPPTEPLRPVEQPRRRRRKLGPLVISLSIAALVLLSLVGFWGWAHNQYYVGNVNGQVGIYQGIPDGYGEHGFSKAIQTSQTSVSQLPLYSQDQINTSIPAANLEAARNIVATLEAQAAQCVAVPTTPGCPPPAQPTGAVP